MSFRGDAKHRTRNLEIPGLVLAHHPGMTLVTVSTRTPAMYHFTALVTCLAILVYFYSSILVSRARGKFGVKLPAISGNPDFERVFRAQMNTLEWLPIFLPSLWLFAIYINDGIAAALGLVWVIGRILYVLGYAKAVEKRGRGFAIQAVATIILWVGSSGAIVWRLVHA
jgi:glutathione S-transferase